MTRFASLRWGRFVLTGAIVIGCGSVLGEEEKPVELRAVMDRVIYSPRKEYFRAWETDGTCTVIMVVDPVSGKVTSDYIETSSGNRYLNQTALEMMRTWKFKPGSPRLIRTTFGFGEASWRNSFNPDRHSQSMNKVLEPFLGKKALVQGSLPEYPRDVPWTKKNGTGVFNLHVDRTGRVTSVTVKRSSGDTPFDQVMVGAMRQWRFRKGPIEIELPLYFALTPERFSVRIPKYP